MPEIKTLDKKTAFMLVSHLKTEKRFILNPKGIKKEYLNHKKAILDQTKKDFPPSPQPTLSLQRASRKERTLGKRAKDGYLKKSLVTVYITVH